MVNTQHTVKLGMLTPSSNSGPEPMTTRLLAEQSGSPPISRICG